MTTAKYFYVVNALSKKSGVTVAIAVIVGLSYWAGPGTCK